MDASDELRQVDGASFVRTVFTVFTATYNRAHTLPRLFQSLVSQDFPEFEWVIVDDGSTDSTGQWVSSIACDAPFPVRYFRQANRGKHAAFNRGVREAKGEFFLSIDSDDALRTGALTRILGTWQSIPEKDRQRFTGVTGLCADEAGNPIGDLFKTSPLDSTSAELTLLENLQGDKVGFHRTEVLRRHPFPERLPTRFVPEGRVWLDVAKELKTRFVNDVYSTVYDSGSGRLSRLDRASRAIGDMEYFGFVLRNYAHWATRRPWQFFKISLNLNRSARHLGRRNLSDRFEGLPALMVRLARFPSFFLYLSDLSRAHGELGWFLAISRSLPDFRFSQRIGNLLRKIYLRNARAPVICRANDLLMELEPWECVDGWILFYPHLFDRRELSFLRSRMPANGVFIDVGANIGFYALSLATALPNSRCIAIEADPYNVAKLKKNVELSCGRNVIVVAEGVSDKQEVLSFRLNTTGNRGGNSFAAQEPGERINIACRSLLQILEDQAVSSVDALKIDIEGYEMPVLRAFFEDAPRSLFPKAIVIEIVPGWEGRGGGDVLSLLTSQGYRVVQIHEHNYMLELTQ